LQNRDIWMKHPHQDNATDESKEDGHRERGRAGHLQTTGGRRRSREYMGTGKDGEGRREKKKKHRTVVYIYSDQHIDHSDKDETRQLSQPTVNTDDLPCISKNKLFSTTCEQYPNNDRSPLMDRPKITGILKVPGERKISRNHVEFLDLLEKQDTCYRKI
jgi:hypothetical protein